MNPGWLAARAIWGALAAVHIWPVFVLITRLLTAPAVEDVASLALLGVVLPIFALKTFDARLLRTNRPWLEFSFWVITTALIHAGPTAETAAPEIRGETAVAVAIGAALAHRGFRRKLTTLLLGIFGRRPRRIRPANHAAPMKVLPTVISHPPRWLVRQRVAARPPPARLAF